MTLSLSCAFATSALSHEHARIAESLGFRRAWFYDSPALYPDVWVQLCRAAERTDRIGLGPAVLVPSLRHPMTNAAAIATLVDIAGVERVAVAIGSGFTGRLTLGQRPLRWRDVRDYVICVRGLLHGEQVEWEGAPIRMMHPDGFAPARPIDVPFLIAAAGPKGLAVARELGAGVCGSAPLPGFDWSMLLTMGTVLLPDESPGSPRAIAAAGHAAAVGLHWATEFGTLDALPGGHAWADVYTKLPARERHLALHDQHLVAVNDRDAPFVTGAVLTAQKLALSPAQWRERLAGLEQAGVTEIAYQPAGPDIPGELERFARLLTA
jgi:5,10-methylenetetrahydromethanopterin reductase